MGDFFNKLRFRTGIDFIKKGKIKEAAEYFEEMLYMNPSNYFLRLESARAHFKLGDFETTKKRLLEIVAKNFSKKTIGTVLEITNWRSISHPRYFNQTPAFSPDGRFIVYASARQSRSGSQNPALSDTAGLYRYNMETGTEELLVDSSYYNCFPCFSPDSTKLIFFSARRDTDRNNIIDHRDNRGLYLLDLSTGKEELLVEDEQLWKKFKEMIKKDINTEIMDLVKMKVKGDKK